MNRGSDRTVRLWPGGKSQSGMEPVEYKSLPRDQACLRKSTEGELSIRPTWEKDARDQVGGCALTWKGMTPSSEPTASSSDYWRRP